MTAIIAIYLLLLGLALGSFYNVVALRVPAGESVVHPPSRCSRCGTRLGARDMIPVVSYLFSRGRCRHCGVSVSALYPLGEAATGLLFVWVYLQTGISGQLPIGLVLVSLSIIISIADIHYMKIPNKVLLFFLPILLVLVVLTPAGSLWNHLGGALAGGGVLLLIAVLSRGGMGMGDVKLFALFGWVIGFPNVLLALFAACLLGLLYGMIVRASGRHGRGQPIPFGPFLAAGTLIAYGYGSYIISGYLSLMG